MSGKRSPGTTRRELLSALQWHFTFMWIFALGGLWYVAAQLVSGHVKTVLFTRRDVSGVWPMARHYFLFGPKPATTGQYNALQKLAYTSAVLLSVLMVWTGAVIYKPAPLSRSGCHWAATTVRASYTSWRCAACSRSSRGTW
jgi:thiosulfate reductase cytochrome b subunit